MVDLASYKKTQKRFLSAGVFLAAELKQPIWVSFIREMLAATPNPIPPFSIEDDWTTRIARWVQALPLDRTFLTARNIFAEVFGEPAKRLDRRATLRIARAMRSVGWQAGHKRIDGVLARGYVQGQPRGNIESLIAEL
ncbi:MAG: hypothetical protein WC943_01480 [Elusimicrobiota bacterium]|jgi:hypothetical protein